MTFKQFTLIGAATLALFSCNVEVEQLSPEPFGNETQPVTEFTAEFLNGKTVILGYETRESYLPPIAYSLRFNSDNTGRYTYTPSPESPITGVNLSWTINNGALALDYGNSLLSSSFRFYDFLSDNADFVARYGQLAFDQLQAAQTQGLLPSQLESQQVTVSESYSIIASHGRELPVTVDTVRLNQLIIPDNVVNNLTGGWQGPSILVDQLFETDSTSEATLIYNPETFDISQDLVGDWAIPLQYVYVNDTNDNTDENGNFLYAYSWEKVTLNDNGTATGKYGNQGYNWSYADGQLELVVTAPTAFVGERYVITPIEQSNGAYLASIDYFQSSAQPDTLAATIVKFDDSALQFTNNPVTELPEFYNSRINLADPVVWDGDRPSCDPDGFDGIFGFNFNADTTAIRGIFCANVLDTNGDPIPGETRFARNGPGRTWSVTDNTLTIGFDPSFLPFLGRIRQWDIIKVADNGDIFTIERFDWYLDADSDGSFESFFLSVSPRISGLVKLDASDYPIAWAASDLDLDGLTVDEELAIGTDFNNPDTDGDGVSDGDEVANGTDPLVPDASSPLIADLTFTDPELSRCVQNYAQNNGWQTVEQMITLNCESTYSVSSLDGINQLFNLNDIYFENTTLSDISGLSGLENLESLAIIDYDAQIPLTDISILSTLTKLRLLSLDTANVTDHTPISNLVNLVFLSSRNYNNRISDIGFVTPLMNLQIVTFLDNEITDLTPLLDKVNLDLVFLTGNPSLPCPQIQSLEAALPNTFFEVDPVCVTDAFYPPAFRYIYDTFDDYELNANNTGIVSLGWDYVSYNFESNNNVRPDDSRTVTLGYQYEQNNAVLVLDNSNIGGGDTFHVFMGYNAVDEAVETCFIDDGDITTSAQALSICRAQNNFNSTVFTGDFSNAEVLAYEVFFRQQSQADAVVAAGGYTPGSFPASVAPSPSSGSLQDVRHTLRHHKLRLPDNDGQGIKEEFTPVGKWQ